MADAPPRSSGGDFSQRMTKKVGPLPVWAWAVIALVIGYYLYKKYQSSSSTSATGTTPASASTPIPSSDQSGGGVGSASGSSGTTTPTAPPDNPPAPVQQKMSNDLAGSVSNDRISSGLGGSIGTYYSPGLGTPNTGGSIKVSGGRLTA